MARPRTNSKVLEMRGAYKAHPERKPKHEPKGALLDDRMPPGLTKYEQNLWQELIAMAAPGVLENGDKWSIEYLVRLMARFRKAKGVVPASELTALMRAMTEFGLTPVSRSKVLVKDKGEKKDGWDDA